MAELLRVLKSNCLKHGGSSIGIRFFGGATLDYQAFSKHGLEREIRKSDFRKVPTIAQEAHRTNLILTSMLAAKTKFSAPSNPLTKFILRKAVVFKLGKQGDQLVERKLARNLRLASGVQPLGRSHIVEKLKIFLKEGVPYRIYRLDIRRFYESFEKSAVIGEIGELVRLSPHSKRLIETLLARHTDLGGVGVPRGLPISAVLTETMMRHFDSKMQNAQHVFFYSRYVDDIVVITSGEEARNEFLAQVKGSLPSGLKLNYEKYTVSSKIGPLVEVKDAQPKNTVAQIEYLGYKFTASNPYKGSSDKSYRNVEIDIADRKVKKYKLRLSRAFYEYTQTKDFSLLRDRVKYLSNNFSVFNIHIRKKKLAGIFHSYPLVQHGARSLGELDHYLRGLVLSSHGRLGKKLSALLTGSMKRNLLANSFVRGHAQKTFIYFTPDRIHTIKQCWKH
ncbi:antiviral reverse transcriptase Drt3a [Variovorax sp. NFACC27]|uniref:antiviral reverse transcriptase Drt3a n=1 Tax=unclassified Variovorax TaxID=663243 RepID=UPI003AAD9F0B